MANACHATSPQSAASTSSSTRPCYDVFINHRGPDVKLKLASTIYHMLDLMGVRVFLDQGLELGDSIPEAIQEAILNASVHIVIFSPKYAESRWCLDELLLILQTNVTIIPVFYSVQPSDLRHVQKGIYANAFYRHRHKGRYDYQKIKMWEEALGSASNLKGQIMFADNCDEGKLLREIVETTVNKMKKVPLEVATFPVGLDEAVQDFGNEVGSSTHSENVQIVGIVGMGGSGKTTLAKELYNRKRSSFSRSSFLADVRDAASTNTLHNLQQNLLKDLRIPHSTFHNIHEGRGMLVRGLRRMTVLIVLDDVDHMDQMQALLPPKHDLGRGSYIIVTTRDANVLTCWGISIYHMKLLDYFNAKQLFCKHAFVHPYSEPGLEHRVENSHNFQHQDLIDRYVKACNGLPLSLKVFGERVNCQIVDFCDSQPAQNSTLPQEITKRLKPSYDALDRQVQKMFLDVARLYIGKKKSLVVAEWDRRGWGGEYCWKTLVNKCLVGLDKYDRIEMHDHLRDLGREIARDVSPSSQLMEQLSQLPSDLCLIHEDFHAIDPQFAASTSSSREPCYDVFIYHRGTDVKHKLASTIYNMLDLMGVQAFLDQEELELGDSFPEAIQDAILNASVHIVIFSPEYAESPWCLEELLLILQTNVTIIPVFYGVQPSHLRHVQKGIYADAFYRHRHKGRYDLQKITMWEEALDRASNLAGQILDADNCDKGRLLREIVETAVHFSSGSRRSSTGL